MIELVFGIVLSVISPNDASADPITMIAKGLITKNRIEQKENNKVDNDAKEGETNDNR